MGQVKKWLVISFVAFGVALFGCSGDEKEATCPEGLTLCADECFDLESHSSHCGECFQECEAYEVCEDGVCLEFDCRVDGCSGMTYCDESDGRCYPGCETADQCPSGEYSEPRCVDNTCSEACVADAILCGEECVPCPTGDNVAAVECQNGECVIESCHDGYELCAGVCSPCPEYSGVDAYACDGQSCVISTCSDGFELCAGVCSPCPESSGVDAYACDGQSCVISTCSDGYELCAGACSPCPESSGVDSYGCDGQSCVISNCEEGFKYCDGRCAECPEDDPNGTLVCSGEQCVLACDSGFHDCFGQCVSSSSVDTCGDRCEPCPSDSNGEPICTEDLECALDCHSGYEYCGGQCSLCPSGPEVLATTCEEDRCVAATCAPTHWVCDGICCHHPDSERLYRHTGFRLQPGLVLDDDKRPQVAFGGPALRLYSWTGIEWEDELLISSAVDDVDIAMDDSGKLFIAYHYVAQTSLVLAEQTQSGWSFTPIDHVGNVGHHVSLKIDSLGQPVIAYFDESNRNLKFARRANGQWSIEVADDSLEDVGRHASLVLAEDDTPHILYFGQSGDGSQLWHAWKSGGGWSHQTVRHGSRDIDAVMDSAGEIHVAFLNDGWDQLYAHWDGASWSTRTIYEGHGSTVYPEHNFRNTSIDINPQGHPEIMFVTGRPTHNTDILGSMHHARFTGSVWNVTEQVSRGDRPLSVAIDADGVRHIGYNVGHYDSRPDVGTYYFNF